MRAVLLALLAAPALAEQPLPHYPGTTLTRIGNDLVISGELYRLAYFVTPDPIHLVARHFAGVWAREGIVTMVDGVPDREAVVSAFYTREGLVRSVVLLPHGKKTLGFAVLKDLWVSADEGKPLLPPLEGALWSGDVRSREADGSAMHRMVVLERGLAEAREEVTRSLRAAGFSALSETEVRGQGRERRRVLIFGRGGEELIVSLLETEPGITAVTQALMPASAGKVKVSP